MLDAETLHKIWNAPAQERIALIEVILQSLREGASQDGESRSERYDGLYSQRSRSAGYEALLSHLQILFAQCKRQLATASDQTSQRPPFGFMKGTGSVCDDIVAPAVPESDWEVLQ